jgi:hypothetical protein
MGDMVTVLNDKTYSTCSRLNIRKSKAYGVTNWPTGILFGLLLKGPGDLWPGFIKKQCQILIFFINFIN